MFETYYAFKSTSIFRMKASSHKYKITRHIGMNEEYDHKSTQLM